MELIRRMTEHDPDKRPMLLEVQHHLELLQPDVKLNSVGNVQYSSGHLLGRGGFAFVFSGLFNGSLVAVKRVTNYDALLAAEKERADREIEVLRHVQHHDNVVKLIDVVKENLM